MFDHETTTFHDCSTSFDLLFSVVDPEFVPGKKTVEAASQAHFRPSGASGDGVDLHQTRQMEAPFTSAGCGFFRGRFLGWVFGRFSFYGGY